MGDPRQLRKKFDKPSHPWQKLRIEEERGLLKEYGFKNKLELWKLNSLLKKYKLQVKELIPRRDAKSEQDKKKLLEKMKQYSLIKEGAIMEDILALTLKDLCERRLQTIVFRKGLARTIKQARQFITHEHIFVGNKKITSPSYILTAEEESLVTFANNSSIKDETHPERVSLQKEIKQEMHDLNLKEEQEKNQEKKSEVEEKKQAEKNKKEKKERSKKPKKVEE
ncbi:MAG: 30S ribosomal protein S4 [Candidatus Woesearchaeota archaeon]